MTTGAPGVPPSPPEEILGALLDAQAAIGDAIAALSLAGTGPVAAALRREDDRWRVTYRGRSAFVADLKGVRILARLIADPGRELHVLDLAGAEAVAPGLPVIDGQARAAYRRRLAELADEVAAAQGSGDRLALARAERERAFLDAELSRGVGIGGRHRTTGSTVERARTSVTRSLRYAVARIAERLPELGEHLERTVRTGVACSYQPDPFVHPCWSVG